MSDNKNKIHTNTDKGNNIEKSGSLNESKLPDFKHTPPPPPPPAKDDKK